MTALTNPAYTVPSGPPGGPSAGIRWLRHNIARFSDGTEHTRRRRHILDLLATVDIAALRSSAAEHTRTLLGGPLDRIAHVVPVTVLADALGLPAVPVDTVINTVIDTVAAIAEAYQPGSGPEEPADKAVAQLVSAFGGIPDEPTAAKISVLVQAYAATAGLVRNAASAPHSADVIAYALHHNPPVRTTRRLAPDLETIVTVDLTGLPFGAGPHHCPGSEHATAIATGIMDAMAGGAFPR